MMWWPPYRKRVLAEADELMEAYGDQARNAASRLCLAAYKDQDYKKAHFYRRVGRYLEKFCDIPQAPYKAEPQENLLSEMLNRIAGSKTLH